MPPPSTQGNDETERPLISCKDWHGRWLGVSSRGPLTATGIYQIVARRGRQCGVNVYPHRFRHHFSHTWLDRGGAERDLTELNGWTSPQMLTRYGASARRTYDRIMDDST